MKNDLFFPLYLLFGIPMNVFRTFLVSRNYIKLSVFWLKQFLLLIKFAKGIFSSSVFVVSLISVVFHYQATDLVGTAVIYILIVPLRSRLFTVLHCMYT